MTTKATRTKVAGLFACLSLGLGCGSDTSAGGPENVHATIGKAGGTLVGAKGTPLEGVSVTIPAGALDADTEISIAPASGAPALPSTAVECGPMFALEPAGLKLAQPAQVTLPFDPNVIDDQLRFSDEVKVWVRQASGWGQSLQTDSSANTVTVSVDSLELVAAGVSPPADIDKVKFDLAVNPKFARCLAEFPDDPSQPPHVHVVVVRGDLNDGLFLRGENIKPGLKFDMFTVENSSLLANGQPDPAFVNFGLAWYQSDLEASEHGSMRTSIKTILLDQIFGFDPKVNLPPTNTFHVGFWFNDPNDVVDCGFDPTKFTPFNGDHHAGPLAMISVPDADSGFGPLCTKPDMSVSPPRCDP